MIFAVFTSICNQIRTKDPLHDTQYTTAKYQLHIFIYIEPVIGRQLILSDVTELPVMDSVLVFISRIELLESLETINAHGAELLVNKIKYLLL